jgi:hypothetical protein
MVGARPTAAFAGAPLDLATIAPGERFARIFQTAGKASLTVTRARCRPTLSLDRDLDIFWKHAKTNCQAVFCFGDCHSFPSALFKVACGKGILRTLFARKNVKSTEICSGAAS